MQLREIHITGFGIFANTRVRGLSRGVNVLYGENEFGKTTVLELIRRVLFGFPTKSTNANQYPALMGGQYGGTLVCELANGRTLNVSRTTGKSGGPLTVRTADGEAADPSALLGMLGNVSESLYNNVFAISLQELQAARQLQGEDVRDRIYGAGLGLGSVSLSDVKDALNKEALDLYRPRGSTQHMHELWKDLAALEDDLKKKRSDLAQYDNLTKRLADLEESTARMEEEQAKREERRFLLKNKEKLYGTYVDLADARAERGRMGQFTLARPETMDELRGLQREVASLERQLNEKKALLERGEEQLKQLRYDSTLLHREADINSLVQGLSQYRDARERLPSLADKHRAERERVSRGLRELGHGWEEETVRSFVLPIDARDQLRRRQGALEEAQKAADDADKEIGRHQRDLQGKAGMALPKQYRFMGIVLMVVGGTGAVLAVSQNQFPVAILSGMAAAIGLAIALAFRTGQGPLTDSVARELETAAAGAHEHLEQARIEWKELLESIGLSPSLTPEGAKQHLDEIEDTMRAIEVKDDTGARIKRLEGIARDTTDAYARVVELLESPIEGHDVATNIEVLRDRLQAARDSKTTSDTLTTGMKRAAQEMDGLQRNAKDARTKLDILLSTNGVSSAEELEDLCSRSDRARELERITQDAERTIRTTVGTGESFSAFLNAIEQTSPEQIHTELSSLDDEISISKQELDRSNQEIGALRPQLSALSSSGEILELESKAEGIRQRLQDARRDWMVARISLFALDHAISRYENTRQPEVIRQAQTMFEQMTGGRYFAVLSPLGSTELRVRDRTGSDKSVDELSRGTREQLYLAMRIGLIAQYEQNAEPLPVIMDDILVNFDDERRPLAVKALAEFAKDRQVIVMTCHSNTLELYRQAGATELYMESDTSLL